MFHWRQIDRRQLGLRGVDIGLFHRQIEWIFLGQLVADCVGQFIVAVNRLDVHFRWFFVQRRDHQSQANQHQHVQHHAYQPGRGRLQRFGPIEAFFIQNRRLISLE